MDIFRAIKRDRRRVLHLLEQLCESSFEDFGQLDHLLVQLKQEMESHEAAVRDTLLRELQQAESARQAARDCARHGEVLVGLALAIQHHHDRERLAALRESYAEHAARCENGVFACAKEFLSIAERQSLGSQLLFLRNVASWAEPALQTLAI